ncbi:hypothetical protein HHK36_007265 [Tetracentron sinense]|uniref:Uncharacterized protein n=1 Tax=Tetracentron sinense TaxID=13715 RepID=A0A835DPZ3_TETSI|nr:hypothetical protein HHK36_007265 [Tetracentron sinense]
MILSSAGGNYQEKVWRNFTKEASTDIQGNYSFPGSFFGHRHESVLVLNKWSSPTNKFHSIYCQDHERAFFDSADWALGKQGAQKPKGPLEALRPKLQPTPHQQVRSRRSAYAPNEDGEDGGNNDNTNSEDQSGHE